MPVIHKTWAPDAAGSIAYYSEVEDDHYFTIDIGVPNTERGEKYLPLFSLQAKISLKQVTVERLRPSWISFSPTFLRAKVAR